VSDDIDIYDANLKHLGVMDRKEAHYAGQWHRTFHCWVYRGGETPGVLFQLRAPRMKNYPDMLDVSAAGHLDAGETVEEGVREVHEELGLTSGLEEMAYLGERVEVADQANGQHNREYQSVYLLRCEIPLAEFAPDPHEVWGLFWAPLREGLELFAGDRRNIEIDGIEYDADEQAYKASRRTVAPDDFLPRIQRYYLSSFIAVERALEGRKYIAIS
jgi:isopentenyldiphosphate isomerase